MKTIILITLFISSLFSNELLVTYDTDTDKNFTITFDSKSYMIKSTEKEKLDKFVDFLFTNYHLSIDLEGHTDSVGSKKQNMKLAIKRAETVKAYFISEGIIESRINTIACGESRPLAPNNIKEHRQINRRVVAKTFETFK